MKRKRFSIEQIVAVLKQAELGMPVADLIRQVGISEQTFYRWKKQYAGMQSDQVRELKQLQDENARLKKLVAELSLDKAILQDVAFKKVARPALRRDVVAYVVSHYGLTMRRACRLLKQPRSVQYYRSVKDPRPELRSRMREIAYTRVRYGYRRVHVLLRREGWQLGRNQAYRLYCEEQLQLRSKLPKRRKMVVTRMAKIVPVKPNDAWSMDFVADQLADGSKFRTLTVVDVFTKEALAIEVGQRLKGEHVVSALNRIVARRGAPRHVFVDNGSEFSGRLLDMWAYHHRAKIDFSRPGKPTDNCHIETFNGSFRDECLNLHWFETLGEAKAIIEAWRRDYNESRPHSALKDLAPAEFARQLALLPGPIGPETPENSR
ncbi:IS3 family transposase [Burkholderia gladioli]|nr:IS3 family transposase [Burkholderia gladioli]ASD78292.1 IS3 family transposase [Burkholderia gladioli pv. gladioli]ASD78754.1 IS3 family transposase [Burkholderia gladioli pv. gladioli]AWY55998.1 IS3 family transposase [Burkholderia gladioli pv. gladioli]AWY56466.1 IS3 family transposase [Burkholderia gladioli pv. gladioli]PRH12717.1 IS3 family transposase [Burkholderia gladioli]